ncbi:MAG: hypothetical protein GY913_06505 [Proteobacteria bacterium]|nr:hypothetical protein [Pseudomonadota bacterium]MCP4916556.1 hypothetical protein [Pseudomonadota bacterium]
MTLLLLACAIEPGTMDLPLGDLERFEQDVQPVLVPTCSSPSCHGDASRPFELYGVHQHRADPDEVYLDTPLRDDEVWHNFVRLSALNTGLVEAELSLALAKPLDPDAGGVPHEGGAWFSTTDDWDYLLLRAWIEDSLEEP